MAERVEIVRVICGLGNQMFSYAYGRYLEKSGMNVYYDISEFKKDKFRKYGLGYFNVKIKMTDQKHTQSGTKGRWQYLKYPEAVKELLLKELIVREEFYTEKYICLKKDINENLSVGIHVRRGDSLKYDYIAVPDQKYFNRAYGIMREKLGDFKCFIFSDDIDWCKKYLKYPNAVFVDINDYLSFELLRLCDHKIISPSTFSWWVAYLGGGIVIAPQEWIRGDIKDYAGNLFSLKYKTNELIPGSWLRL